MVCRASSGNSEGDERIQTQAELRADEFERFHRRIYDFGQSYSAFRARTRSWFGWSVTHFKSGCQLDLEASDITF